LLQNGLHKAPFSDVPETATQKLALSSGIIVLIVFGFFRPLTLTMVGYGIGTLSAFEIFALGISFLLSILVFLNLHHLRIDRTMLLSILFCLYCAQSAIWGSRAFFVARAILPFIVFFAARIFITESKQIGVILIAMVIGYIVPIVTSTYDIISGRSIEMISYWTGIERFAGSFIGSHILGYAMLFFSFILCLLKWTRQVSGRLTRFGLLVLQLLAIFCLYKSYTRTALLGFIIFWAIYLWGANKKRLLLAVIACGLIAIMASQKVETIFWQTGHLIQEHDLNAASSGRLFIWSHNLKIFLDSTVLQKLFGHGLGSEGRKAAHFVAPLGASHNDYLSLLMNLGMTGLLIYLTLLASLLWDIYTCELDKSVKYLFLGILVSAGVMNFVSNAVIFRVELSQYFWLFMGFFYFAKERARAGQLSSTELG